MSRTIKGAGMALICWLCLFWGSNVLGQYQIIDLGTLSGPLSRALSINNNGQIVGSSSFDFWDRHATLFDPTGGGHNTDLGFFGGAYESTTNEATAISDDGRIVGSVFLSRDSVTHAFLFDPTGGGRNIDLGTLGGSFSDACSTNTTGQIVGWACDYDNHERATLFDDTGGGHNIDLGTLGGNKSKAFSINNNGQIVGWAYNSSNDAHAVLFDPTGEGHNIDLAPFSDLTLALAINNNGQIAGVSNIRGAYHATLFDLTGEGNNIDLGIPSDGVYNYSEALSINDKGQIVGFSSISAGYRATLFDSTGEGCNIDLNTLLPNNSGWTLSFAYSINNRGWIVGEGINPAGETHAFLLIPEPASLSLLALGGAALLRRRTGRA